MKNAAIGLFSVVVAIFWLSLLFQAESKKLRMYDDYGDIVVVEENNGADGKMSDCST